MEEDTKRDATLFVFLEKVYNVINGGRTYRCYGSKCINKLEKEEGQSINSVEDREISW